MPRTNSLKTPPTPSKAKDAKGKDKNATKAKDAGPKKRRARPDHDDDDDSSVDSRGNIRDLIVSSDEGPSVMVMVVSVLAFTKAWSLSQLAATFAAVSLMVRDSVASLLGALMAKASVTLMSVTFSL